MSDGALTDKQVLRARELRVRNWPMIVGSILALIVLGITLLGPLLAPSDPMKENYIAEFGGKFNRPPFPPGIEGFPLGSDEWGRDVLSRLLWGVRPTLMLVLVVAALRMVIGILFGLYTGWSKSPVSKAVDSLISVFLSIPVLFVALCIVAALARRWGVWAFILGLSLTGWAEAARLVQEQTRSVKTQPFIEATRAMGAAGGQIILSHVIPHVLPMIWIQLAFEVSSVMLASAALNFLGYFVNAVWIPIADFVGVRISGTPELGQMLGVSARQQPWTAVFAGAMVFLIVLAFNMLGEGLRLALNPERRRRAMESKLVIDRAGGWLEERIYFAVTEWRRTATTGGAFAALLLVVFGGGWFLWYTNNNTLDVTQVKTVGSHLWPAELRDAQGTGWSDVAGPAEPNLVWSFVAEDGFISGPVVDRQGNLYLNAENKRMYSISREGLQRGFVELPDAPVRWPALTPEGNIIVADEKGGLTGFMPDGRLLWYYASDPPDGGLSSPIVGPDGLIYYAVKNFLVAVNPLGQRSWQIILPTFSYTSPLPRLSPDGAFLFFEDTIIDSQTGATVFKQTSDPMDKYLSGSNSKTYYRTQDSFLEWQPTEKGAVMIRQAKLDTRVIGTDFRFPFNSGISPSGNVWILYSGPYEFPRIIWTDPKGESPQVIDLPYKPSHFIGIDVNGVTYICGLQREHPLECRAIQLATGMVLWKVSLESEAPPVGGAIIEGRIYVATAKGEVFAIGR